MWKDLDMERMAEEENACSQPRPPEEIEQIVVMVRFELFNRMLPCGAKALRRRLDRHYHVKPLPSERTIGRILARNNLIERR
jgi:hypothetical protein